MANPTLFPCSRHAVSRIGFSFARVLPPGFLPRGQSILWGGHFESDHATMSGRFSVWIMWTKNSRDVLISAETFQSLAPFSSFILGFFGVLTGLYTHTHTHTHTHGYLMRLYKKRTVNLEWECGVMVSKLD